MLKCIKVFINEANISKQRSATIKIFEYKTSPDKNMNKITNLKRKRATTSILFVFYTLILQTKNPRRFSSKQENELIVCYSKKKIDNLELIFHLIKIDERKSSVINKVHN